MSLLITFIDHLNWSLCPLLSVLSSVDPLVRRERQAHPILGFVSTGEEHFVRETLITCISLTLLTNQHISLFRGEGLSRARWASHSCGLFECLVGTFCVMNHLHLTLILLKWMCTLGDNVSWSRHEFSFYGLCCSVIYNRFLSFNAVCSLWKFQMSH